MTFAWDRSRRRAWQVGFGHDLHVHGPDQDCAPRCIPATVDPRDDDMLDANLLSLTDPSGASIWSPRGLEDFDAVPARTFTLWRDMRAGLLARGEPWAWWRVEGNATSHLFAAAPGDAPIDPARCGLEPDPAARWVREGATHCRVCEAVATRDAAPRTGFGTIGGVAVGTSA